VLPVTLRCGGFDGDAPVPVASIVPELPVTMTVVAWMAMPLAPLLNLAG